MVKYQICLLNATFYCFKQHVLTFLIPSSSSCTLEGAALTETFRVLQDAYLRTDSPCRTHTFITCVELGMLAEDGVGTRLVGDVGGLEVHWAGRRSGGSVIRG